jgi:hypothetical protein
MPRGEGVEPPRLRKLWAAKALLAVDTSSSAAETMDGFGPLEE